MKNIYTCFIALAVGHLVTAQSTFDFESHPLNAESYDNGSAGNGDFVFSDNETISLTNVYDTIWGGIWSGFSISTITDNTTAGWSNQYSAYPGAGAGASNAYAVFYGSGSIAGVEGTTAISEFKITNATYAALSMKDGDFFGKQFGSPLNAAGSPDGTNGEDYFRVWVLCESLTGDKDSLEFYLADYRFADSTQDYILDTWETIDLSQLNINAHTVSFRLESSDQDGSGGFYTPAYFAIDDVKTYFTFGMDEEDLTKVSVYPNPASDFITIDGGEGIVRVISSQGTVVLEQEHHELSTVSLSAFPAGIYAIQVQNASGSYTNRLIVQ